ncbi:MAG TPA: methyltransferase domain-containing protein [Gaiellaceae bacterium]|nr:methyltransferase domain-containing protein [Gaiellaceae bacterium]
MSRLDRARAAAQRHRKVRFGTLRRTSPVGERWGWDRGLPVDRYYIERFLGDHREDIRGRVLEVKDDDYARRFGSQLERVDVLDIDSSNTRATIVADLAAADEIPEGSFDCVVVTQTLQYIYDVHAAIGHTHRILRPGGVALVTVPAVSRVVVDVRSPDYWRFTAASCTQLFRARFGEVSVESLGNVLSSITFLSGMATEDLRRSELDVQDERFPVIVAVRALKE